MPYQSRAGVWHCRRCEQPFQSYQDVVYHESIGACHNFSQSQQVVPQQSMPVQHAANLAQSTAAAASASRRLSLERGGLMNQPHPSSSATAYQATAAMSGLPSSSNHPLTGRAMTPLQGPRVLLGATDTSQLTKHDSVAVQNVEMFAVDHPGAIDNLGNRLAIGLVGVRCIHCVVAEAGPRSVIFPRSLHEVGDCIREVAEWHLGKCHRAPQNIRRVLEEALQRRHKAKNEGGAAWLQEEQDRSKLIQFCSQRCRDLRLVENYPPRSGIMFSYFPQSSPSNETLSFEDSKQSSRPTSALGGAFGDIPLDDLHPEPFMVPDQQERGFDAGISTNFPFVREVTGDWVCKFCQQLHPHYRDAQYRWTSTDQSPPPADFIDYHLNHCRMYQQSLLQDYRGPMNPVALPNPMRTSTAVAGLTGAEASRPADRTSGFSVTGPGIAHTTSLSGPGTPYARAVAYLENNDLSRVGNDGKPLPPEANLMVDEDRLLLTDYFYFLFKQLRLCRFSETDRKTRGGKRQAIKIGYGGLQCVHCAGQSNPRKFFWANVDRIANSFAEMPNHILKCRQCPQPTRNALLTLKETHAEQMTRLPRGSQKIFLRRMWRRLHENDPKDESDTAPTFQATVASRRKAPPSSSIETTTSDTPRPTKVARKNEPTGDSPSLVERSPGEAARALTFASMQTGPPSPSSRVLLSTPEDKQWLSDYDCFIRKQIEVFCATSEDVLRCKDPKSVVKEGQVGIRCIHCALAKGTAHEDEAGVAYPASINGLYDTVREFMRLHLETCANLPQEVQTRLVEAKGASSLSSILRNYYQLSAKSIGLIDSKDGIRASGQSLPLQSQDFTFAERKSPPKAGHTGIEIERQEEV